MIRGIDFYRWAKEELSAHKNVEFRLGRVEQIEDGLHQAQVTIDGEAGQFQAVKVYVVNSGMMGTGFRIVNTYSIEDGLLDVFLLDKEDSEAMASAIDRFLNRDTERARRYYRQCREITIDTDPDQPVWSDGEYLGRTPITVKVLPSVLPIVVP